MVHIHTMLRPISKLERTLEGANVLVTGAGGFIGSHLVERLLACGCKVNALVRYSSTNNRGWLSGLENPNLAFLHGDIRDQGFVSKAVEGNDYVFHLAALIAIPYSYVAPQSYVDVNMSGTLNVLESARRLNVRRVLHTSTSEIYGTAQFTPMPETHPINPQSPYAATKSAADQLALSYHMSFDSPVTVVRPFNTYGVRQSMRAVIPTVCFQALYQEHLTLGNTTSERDFTYVDDTCAGFIHAAVAEGVLGETINLGFGACISIGKLVEVVGDILAKNLHFGVEAQRLRPPASEVERLLSDNSKAKRLLQWQPEVGIREGLKAVLDWTREQRSQKTASYVL